MVLFRERLRISPTAYIASALIIPATIIVFAPINFIAGVIIAIVLYAVAVIIFITTEPTIEVTDDTLVAGRAHIERSLLGTATPYSGEEAVLQRGQRLDARAWLLMRGWIKNVVKVPILDAEDPTPYWLLSTRRPAELARILNDRGSSNLPKEPEGPASA
jgi:hypothetical protein